MAEIVKETRDDIRIKAGVVLDATLWSIPELSHMGIRIGAPPIARVAPRTPAPNPAPTNLCLLLPFIGITWILSISTSSSPTFPLLFSSLYRSILLIIHMLTPYDIII